MVCYYYVPCISHTYDIKAINHICRELWFRASLAWQDILGDKSGNRNTLLVAHNAVNQALVATAIGLPPTYFRRLLQNNAATTVLDFQPNGNGPPRVNLDRLNQVNHPFLNHPNGNSSLANPFTTDMLRTQAHSDRHSERVHIMGHCLEKIFTALALVQSSPSGFMPSLQAELNTLSVAAVDRMQCMYASCCCLLPVLNNSSNHQEHSTKYNDQAALAED